MASDVSVKPISDEELAQTEAHLDDIESNDPYRRIPAAAPRRVRKMIARIRDDALTLAGIAHIVGPPEQGQTLVDCVADRVELGTMGKSPERRRLEEIERELAEAKEDVKASWRKARDANGQTEAFRILEAMVDRVGYGRRVTLVAPDVARLTADLAEARRDVDLWKRQCANETATLADARRLLDEAREAIRALLAVEDEHWWRANAARKRAHDAALSTLPAWQRKGDPT